LSPFFKLTLLLPQLMSDMGIMTIEHADFEGVERLSSVLGSEITSTFDHPNEVKLGECKLIEEIIIGEDKVSPLGGTLFVAPYLVFPLLSS